MKLECDLAIVCAIPLEQNAILKLLKEIKFHTDTNAPFYSGACGVSNKLRVCVLQCGAGRVNVEKKLPIFLDCVQPTQLWSVGLCGGLSSRLTVGDLVSPSVIVSTKNDKPISCLAFPVCKHQNKSDDLYLSSEEPLTTAAAKNDWYRKTKAVAVDMESYFVAKLVTQREIPFSVLRAISDDATTEIDCRLLHLLKSSGDPHYRKILWELLRSPRFLFVLLKMKKNSDLAMQNLVNYLSRYNFSL